METEEELHYEEEFPSGQEAPEVQGAPAAGHDVEEEDAGVHEAQSGEAPSGGPPSLHRSSEASVEAADCMGNPGGEEILASRSGKSDQPGPGGRRTQHRVVCLDVMEAFEEAKLISNLDPSVQWQDLKDFGRKVGEVNYANVIFSGGRKYGVLEYCDSQSVVLALRELEGLRLRSLPVSLKRDRGDFDSLVASAPPRWGGPPEGGPPRQQLRQQPPRPSYPAPHPSRGPPAPRWAPGLSLGSPELHGRERAPPPEVVGKEALRGPDYPTRSGGSYSGAAPLRGGRGRGGHGGGAPQGPAAFLLRPEEGGAQHAPSRSSGGERHHQPYGGGSAPLRGARGAPLDSRGPPIEDEGYVSRRGPSPGRGRAPEPSRVPRRSRSPSPSWRAHPVHAGYRELTSKEPVDHSGRRIAMYDAPTWRGGAQREGPSKEAGGAIREEGPCREYPGREGGAGAFINGRAVTVVGSENLPYKHSGYHGASLRESSRASPDVPYSRSSAAAAAATEPLPNPGGPRGEGWERPSRVPGSPRVGRGPAGPSSAFGGGRLPPPPARGYEGEGRSRSRSWERRRYSDSKRRRASPSSSAPYMAGVAAAHPASPPDGDWRGISTRPEEALPGEGAPLPSSESRRRHRSRSPRAVRDSYGGTPAHHMQEGRYVGAQAPLGCEAVGPQGGGPPRHTRDRREGGAGGLGEAPPPHHQGGFWGGTRRDDNIRASSRGRPLRAVMGAPLPNLGAGVSRPPRQVSQRGRREEEVLAGDLGPPPGKRAPLLRLTEAITAPAEKGGRPLPLVAWAQDSLPTALSQRQTTLLREAPEGLQGLRDGGLTACSPKHAGAKFSLCLVAEIADRGVAAEPHWLVCSSSAFKVL
ncbi:arginine serine-rich splicing factor related protein [Cyclospora cayetanensis]|uniref:Arginine serine-rich splicing factor related protein n=1 Tax=Cyclospora cayetanensis TaxID=88456 RepID=A0A1D3D5X0_9EIME|nr:arginine serine-rich splicing factor related protein [Cyclospora cayetanensis]